MKKPQYYKPTSLFYFWLFYGLLQMRSWQLNAQAGISLMDHLLIPSYHEVSAATEWRYPAGAGRQAELNTSLFNKTKNIPQLLCLMIWHP